MPRRDHKTTQTDDAAAFDARFSRYRRLLRFVATRVLGGPERAEEAVENCWRSASRNPPRFEYDSAFSSWLARILIDEALAIRRSCVEYEYGGAPSQQAGATSERGGSSMEEKTHESAALTVTTFR